jgi:hypothetical protein
MGTIRCTKCRGTGWNTNGHGRCDVCDGTGALYTGDGSPATLADADEFFETLQERKESGRKR